LNILVVYGGKNDNSKFYRNQIFSSSGIISDLNILNVENLNWIKVEINGLKNLQKCAFGSCLV
jgi:hypothetical protein